MKTYEFRKTKKIFSELWKKVISKKTFKIFDLDNFRPESFSIRTLDLEGCLSVSPLPNSRLALRDRIIQRGNLDAKSQDRISRVKWGLRNWDRKHENLNKFSLSSKFFNGVKWHKMETFSMEKMVKPLSNSPFMPLTTPPPPPPCKPGLDLQLCDRNLCSLRHVHLKH